jgi:MurNAc alpha-1-phosphate uridylyltransferase
MKAMLLAAGRGERMGELTRSLPKPLLEVAGERLIERQLRCLAAAGVIDIVINLSYQGAAIRELVGRTSKWGQNVAYSEEGEPALETGGGIIHALPLLGEAPFLVVNTDIYTDFDYTLLTRARSDNVLVLVPNPPHHAAGDFGLAANGRVTGDPPLQTYSGIALLSPALFAGIPPGHQRLRPILDRGIERDVISGLYFDGFWQDVGTPERLAEARRHGRL